MDYLKYIWSIVKETSKKGWNLFLKWFAPIEETVVSKQEPAAKKLNTKIKLRKKASNKKVSSRRK